MNPARKSLLNTSLSLLLHPKCRKFSPRFSSQYFHSSAASYHFQPNKVTSADHSLTRVLSELNRLASRGRIDKVLKIWDIMQKILKHEALDTSSPDLKRIAEDIDANLIQSRILFFYVYLLKAYVNAQDLKGAEEAMQKYFVTSYARVVQPTHLISDLELQHVRAIEGIVPVTPTNPSVYTLMMKLYAQKLNSEAAAKVYEALEKDLPQMAATDCLANNTLLSAYVDANQYNSAKLFFTLKYRSPLNASISETNTVIPDMATYAIMMKLYAALNEEEQLNRSFEIITTDKAFQDEASRKDAYKYNIMLAYISRHKTEKELMDFFQQHFCSSLNEQTLKNIVTPTIHTYNTLFKFFSEQKDIARVQQLFELMVHDREKLFNNATDLFMDKTAFHVIIDAHLKSNKDRQAREILENFFQTKKNHFDKNLMKPTVSHYNLFLIHYAKKLMQSELDEILTMMEQDGTQPDANSAFAAVACAVKRNAEHGVEEFKRWFISPMGTSKTPRPKRFPTTSRVYELMAITLIKEKQFELLEELIKAYDKDNCKRSGSTYRKVLFAYLNNGRLEDAIRVFRTYFISPASHAKAGFKADLQMCNTILYTIYNQKDTKDYLEIIRALRFVRDKLQQKTPQEVKEEREKRRREIEKKQQQEEEGYLA